MYEPFTVFVYGTLKPGGHYWPRFCEGKVSEVQPAKIRGELYDLHLGYPGLLLRGDRWVQGCLLTFASRQDLEQLDWLEGYEANRPMEQNEYIRLKVPCYTPAGESLGDFWAYEMTETTLRQHKGTLIESGDWPV
ncbi:MAG TPA: hypothetical protein DCX06_03010 [Opitutae bacterium]|nr:hypothetical protein [Opitutae bacterium]